MAVGIAPDQSLLADAATGRGLARLTTLQPVFATPLVFSPDGTTLVARTEQKTVLVWDLRRIRDQLAPQDWTGTPRCMRLLGGCPSRDERAREADTSGGRGRSSSLRAGRAAEWAVMNRRLAAKPNDADALIHRGWLSTRQLGVARARVDLEQSLRLRPDDSDALWLLGETYQESGKLAGAMAAYDRLVERGWRTPTPVPARPSRAGHRTARSGRRRLQPCPRRPPGLGPRRLGRARAMIRLGRHREALADLDFGIAKTPRDYTFYELRPSSTRHSATVSAPCRQAERKLVATQ